MSSRARMVAVAVIVVAVVIGLQVALNRAQRATSAPSEPSVAPGEVCPAQKETPPPEPANASPKPAPAATPSNPQSAQAGVPSLIDLGSTGCVPCQQMAPILKELAAEYRGKVKVEVIDVYEHGDLAERYGVRAIPTQVFLDAQGKEVSRHIGFYPKEEIVAKFKELGFVK